MATQVSTVYQQICTVLLEDGGLTLGLITPAHVVQFIGEVLTDFLTKTGIVKKVVSIPAFAGVDTYTLPDQISDTQYSNFGQSYLHRTSAFYLDNSNPAWESSTSAFPVTWKQDEVQPKQIQIRPTPAFNGAFVTASPSGFYGILSSVAGANTLNILGPATGLYGVVNGFSGAPYVEALVPFYGVWSSATVDNNNVSCISTAIPSTLNPALSAYLELIPDSFTPYLKYGALAKIFAQDGECKDLQKSYYCAARYAEGISLAAAIMGEEFEQEAA
jgi:hypothetical protein